MIFVYEAKESHLEGYLQNLRHFNDTGEAVLLVHCRFLSFWHGKYSCLSREASKYVFAQLQAVYDLIIVTRSEGILT